MSGVALMVGALGCVVALMAASQAQALAITPTTLACGAQVTTSVTLAADIGPCPSTADGIDIMASGITVNLNGHNITGMTATNNTNSQSVGIQLMNVHNVKVIGPGTIQNFDAGISVNGGQSNTIQNLRAQNNVAHVLFSGGVCAPNCTPLTLLNTACDFGDGILAQDSSYNTFLNVVANGNGPFDGIALVGLSSYNKVLRSNSFNNNVANIIKTGPTAGQGGPCGPFGANIVGQGRPYQDIGIRIEGPGATHNIVGWNSSFNNMLEGISIHGNVCPNNPAGVPAGPPNTNNLVEHNMVKSNGFGDPTGPLDGIGVLSQGPAGVVCVAYDNSIVSNFSSYNARDGIFIGGRGSTGNTITGNRTDYNAKDGLELSAPTPPNPATGFLGLPGTINSIVNHNEGHGNHLYDGQDGNVAPVPCDNNVWEANHYLTFNPACVMAS